MYLSSGLWRSLRQTACPRFLPAILIAVRLQSTKAANLPSTAPTAAAGDVPPTAKPLLPSFLVTPQILNTALLKEAHTTATTGSSTSPRLVPLCATWFLPNDARNRTGLGSFLTVRVPGARFLDIDAVCDTTSPYPHMLPGAPDFARAMGQLGLQRDDTVVVYDDAEAGIFSAPRAAWMLKVFGHRRVHILNNFKLWVDQGFPVEKGEPVETVVERTTYPVPKLDESKVITFDGLRRVLQHRGEKDAEELTVVDARSPGRWEGKEPEPRKGISSGHMPGSINIPFSDVLNARTKAFLTAKELRVYFECKDVDPKKPIVSTCGTGVTACVLDAALTEAGYPEEGRRVYDGSWTEWASRKEDSEGLIIKGKV